MRQRGFEPISEAGLKLVPKMVDTFQKKGFKQVFINKEYIEPQRETSKSAGSDVYYTGDETITIKPQSKVAIITNVKAYMQGGEMLIADVRSSQGMFSDLRLCNTIGIIDEDYYNNVGNEGNIGIGIKNTGDKPFEIKKGTAIAQLIFVPCLAPDNPAKDKQREDGFGSTTK
jgi:dUTP pyrophosphatase